MNNKTCKLYCSHCLMILLWNVVFMLCYYILQLERRATCLFARSVRSSTTKKASVKSNVLLFFYACRFSVEVACVGVLQKFMLQSCYANPIIVLGFPQNSLLAAIVSTNAQTCLQMRGFGISHDISKENLFSFNENNLINESPGWNGFDWVIRVRMLVGMATQDSKRLDRFQFSSFPYNHMSYGLCLG